MALRHDLVAKTLLCTPILASHVGTAWLERQARHPDLLDAHLIYRLLAAGPIGWAMERVWELEALLGRLHEVPWLDAKIVDLLNGNPDQVDSVAGELVLAD